MGSGQGKHTSYTCKNEKTGSYKKGKYVPTRRRTLVLGSGGVGKTTVVKQLTTQWGEGFSHEQKIHLLNALRAACVERVHEIIKYAAEDHEEQLENDTSGENEWIYSKIEEVRSSNNNSPMSEEWANVEDLEFIGEELEKLWGNPLVQEIAQRKITSDNEKELLFSSADKFLPEVRRIFSKECTLTDEQALLVRCPTKDIVTTNFSYRKEVWSVRDVGGQIHHRASWKSAFDGIGVVLYIASLTDYDKYEGQTKSKNLLSENLKLFENVCAQPELRNKPFVLLLNKEDIFEQALKERPLNVCPLFETTRERCPEESDIEYKDRCCKTIYEKFKEVYSNVHMECDENSKAPFEYYSTCATDRNFVTKSMQAVFSSVHKLINAEIANSGLM